MEKHITDQEFQLLKNKIQLAESYIRDLQTVHLSLTGKQHIPTGPMSHREMWETAEQLIEDLGRMV
jgi:hypothetical protein